MVECYECYECGGCVEGNYYDNPCLLCRKDAYSPEELKRIEKIREEKIRKEEEEGKWDEEIYEEGEDDIPF